VVTRTGIENLQELTRIFIEKNMKMRIQPFRNEECHYKKMFPKAVNYKLHSGAFLLLSNYNKHDHVKRIVHIEEPAIDFPFQWSAAFLTLTII